MSTFVNRTHEEDADFLSLFKLLDVELAERDDDEHAFYAQLNQPVGLAGIVVAYRDGEASGAVRLRNTTERRSRSKGCSSGPTGVGGGSRRRS